MNIEYQNNKINLNIKENQSTVKDIPIHFK